MYKRVMDNQSTALHTDGVIEDYFILGDHLHSTRSANSYSALDKSRNLDISIWILRHPLAVNSEAVKRFLLRLKTIDSIRPAVSKMTAYGVDAEGRAFAVFPPFDGKPVADSPLEMHEAERRFMRCLNVIKELHNNQVVCGDLCGSSFMVNREGSVELTGVLGSFDVEASATAMLPPVATLHYMAPEQKSGGGLEPASDVYAMGVLGYRLFTGCFPLKEEEALGMPGPGGYEIPLLSEAARSAPVWADEVIMKCLAFQPAERYQSAGEVLSVIHDIQMRVLDSEYVPAVTSGKEPQIQEIEEHALEIQEDLTLAPESSTLTGSSGVRFVFTGLAAVVVGVLIALAYISFGNRTPGIVRDDALKSALLPLRAVTGKALGKAIDIIGDPDLPVSEKENSLGFIADSDDPIAHNVLVTTALKTNSEVFRKLCEKAIIERARRLGLMRSAEETGFWLDSIKSGAGIPSYYGSVFKALDKTLPIEARFAALREGYAANPDMILRLTAALVLDSSDLKLFQPVLAQLIGDTFSMQDAASRSALALILVSPKLSARYGDDVVQRRDSLPDKDLLWILALLAERGDSNLRAIANVAYERDLVSPVNKIFLKIVRDRVDVPPAVLKGLIHAASSALTGEDISAFGKWFDVDVVRVLLAVCASEGDKQIALDAFDTLASRSITLQPSGSLVEWVRDNHWSDRGSFLKVIGQMAYINTVGQSEVKEALKVFDRYIQDQRWLNILLDSDEPYITRIVLERYADYIEVGRLISLLVNPDRDVRLAAIRSLKKHNDVGALRMIIDMYEREKDPVVKKAYQESFWVIGQRVE